MTTRTLTLKRRPGFAPPVRPHHFPDAYCAPGSLLPDTPTHLTGVNLVPQRFQYDRENEFLLDAAYQIKRHDVLCGSTAKASPGNERFRFVAEMRVDRYQRAQCRKEKMQIVTEIVDAVRQAGGNFVRLVPKAVGDGRGDDDDDNDGAPGAAVEYHDIGNLKAREKASHALRSFAAKYPCPTAAVLLAAQSTGARSHDEPRQKRHPHPENAPSSPLQRPKKIKSVLATTPPPPLPPPTVAPPTESPALAAHAERLVAPANGEVAGGCRLEAGMKKIPALRRRSSTASYTSLADMFGGSRPDWPPFHDLDGDAEEVEGEWPPPAQRHLLEAPPPPPPLAAATSSSAWYTAATAATRRQQFRSAHLLLPGGGEDCWLDSFGAASDALAAAAEGLFVDGPPPPATRLCSVSSMFSLASSSHNQFLAAI